MILQLMLPTLSHVRCMACNIAFSRPQEVVIFIVGGTTYEESRSVALQNASNSGIRFILGGTVVLNSKRYASCRCCYYSYAGGTASPVGAERGQRSRHYHSHGCCKKASLMFPFVTSAGSKTSHKPD